MRAKSSNKVSRHQNGSSTHRTTKEFSDPEYLNTPPLTESSGTGSESGSFTESDLAAFKQFYVDEGNQLPSGPIPHFDSDQYQISENQYETESMYSSHNQYADNQAMQTAKLRAQSASLHPPTIMPRKKKAQSRVLFSDQDSVISASTSNSSASETETERGPRSHTKGRSAPRNTSTATARALQMRMARQTEDPRTSSRRVPSKAARGGEETGDELMTRVAGAIPDLHRLLSRYKETNGELSVKDQLRKRIEAQQMQMMRNKEDIIESLMAQLDDSARERADERLRTRELVEELEQEMGNMRRKVAAAGERASKAETRAKVLEESERRLVRQHEQHLLEKTAFMKRAAEERERAVASKQSQMLEEFKKQTQGIKAQVENDKVGFEKKLAAKQEEHKAAIQKEKEAQQALAKKEIEEQQAAAKKEKEELESKLREVEKKLADATQDETDIQEKVDKRFAEEKEKLIKAHEEEKEALVEQHKDYCNDQMKGFMELQEMINKDLVKENETLKSLLGERHSPPSVTMEDVPE